MLDYISEIEGVTGPVCIMWGEKDFAAPPEVREAYLAVPAKKSNVEVHVFPGIDHGYMFPLSPKAFDAKTRAFSMGRALSILQGLRAETKATEAAE